MSTETSGSLGRSLGLFVAFAAGAGIMILELAAPRVVQPWFGASTFVWTNVIGVILVALAAGYQIGGALSPRPGRPRRIALALVIAAALAALTPWAAGVLAGWLSPAPGTLANLPDSNRILELSSLLVAALLFAPPVLVIATVTPQLVSELEAGGLDGGRASGRIFAIGTLGSLLGTFAPTYFLVPTFGSRVTVLIAAGLLALAGLAAGLGRPSRTVRAAALLLVALVPLAIFSNARPLRPQEDFEHSMREIETAYQYVRVAEETAREDETQRERVLKINEGLRDFHSIALGDRPTTGGKYYDTIAALATTLRQDGDPWRVAVLGSGAGTTAGLLRRHWGDRVGSIVNVDIDPVVLALEEEFGVAGGAADHSFALDGRAFLRLTDAQFDLIVVDAYAQQIDIPAHMATVEFFELVRKRLAPKGCLVLNASSRDLESPLLRALASSMRAAGFPEIVASPVQYWGNTMLWTHRDRQPDLSLSLRGPTPKALAPAREAITRWSTVLLPRDEDLLLRDGDAPTEWLGLQERRRGA